MIRFETFCTMPVISRSAPNCFGELEVAAAAGLQIAVTGGIPDRRDIEQLEPA